MISLLFALVLAACSAPAAGECRDAAGTLRTADESWTAEDGCNTCSCAEGGGYACTEMACGGS